MNKVSTKGHGTRAEDKIRLIYLLSASHSGSTLLAHLLGAHRDIGTVGELKLTSLGDPDRYLCSCKSPIRKCAFWEGIREDMARQGIPFDIFDAGTDLMGGASPYVRRLLRPLHRSSPIEAVRDLALSLSLCWKAKLNDIQLRNAALAACVRNRLKKDFLVDSSKTGLRLKYLLRNPAFEIRVIRLTRDGRGVALTYMDPARFADAKDPKLRQGGMGGTRDSERLSMMEAAREWKRSNEEAEEILSGIDRATWTDLKYEDMCRDPSGALKRIFDFLDVSRDDAAYPGPAGTEYHIVGNGMRLDFTSEIELDERWKSALSPSDIASFQKVGGAMNHRLGYR